MIDITIIEDDLNVREGLKYLIDTSEGYSCKKVYETCEDALENLQEDKPDVILIDLNLPGMSGIDGIKEITKLIPDITIIVLTSSDEDKHIFEALSLGATGYLKKDISASKLIEAIDEAVKGGAPMSGEVARKVIKSLKKEIVDYNFTKRENEILKLICDGKSYKTISEEVFIEERTVKFHAKNIFDKLGVKTKSKAISKALKEGLC